MVNCFYKQRNVLRAIRQELRKNGVVQLHSILDEREYDALLREIKKSKFKNSYVPDKQRYRYAKSTMKAANDELSNLLVVLGMSVRDATALHFEAGDYMILHDTMRSGTCVFLDCTPVWNDAWGGQLVFKDKEDTIVSSVPNTLVVARNTKWFVKYVNHRAKGRRMLLRFE